MLALYALVVVLCLIGAYFQRGLNRYMLILLAIAIVELKSLAVGIKVFSLTVIVLVLLYFLGKRKR